MSAELLSVLVLLTIAIVLFVIGRPRVDAIALAMIVALPLTGVITVPEALAGFSDPNIVLIAALFVLGEGLVRTGVAQRVGDWLISRGGEGERRIVVLLMSVVALMGSVMSSTAVVAIFIPIVLRVSQQTGIPKSRLLMPTSVAALVSGMLTLVATTPNLIVNSELVREGAAGFRFFSFTPIGLPLLALAIGYMLLVRRAPGDAGGAPTPARPTLYDWIERYRLHGRAFRLRVEPSSPLANTPLGDVQLDGASGARVIAIERRVRFGVAVLSALPATELHAGDVLLVDVAVAGLDLEPLCERCALTSLPMGGAYFIEHAGEVGMAETLVPPDSGLVGAGVRGSALLAAHGLTIVGLRRGRNTHDYGLENERLKVGDTLLVVGPWCALRALQSDGPDLITLAMPAEGESVAPSPRRGPYAVGSMLVVVVLMLFGVVPNVQAAFAGCLLMGLFRCIDLDSAYRSIHWRSLVLIVGMLPFSLALQRTGGVDMAAQALLDVVGGAGVRAVLACVFAMTAVIGLVISNTATAVLMAPVAIALAHHLHASPYPFAMIVALASSAAFMTPISSPVNTLVSTAGNYSFGDFVRIGTPLALGVMALSVLIVPWLLPA
ncbi:SLC13 family permease [Paraburkholderia caballeronis]|uniref:SLC13 family permease n=1 Tax=Paraburkholderia caballeronis TaxID=416943 RepID=UPI001066A189|nr:SLC13 family permease [Paraburkholderia caballeronis]TDV04973.1 di/tricarboxylate transporter [Paraburkholderia caballeronis]TDV08141.1 di/tricarboxylate transporter [Paraburkholderia caballeronis]TDV19110.1 di/tricarboxylate transporter [Paraburkholderia caballeronis]